MNIFKNISIINKFIRIFETGKEINLSGFSDSEKSILISALNFKLNKKSVVVASDLISAGNLENMLVALNLKVGVLKERINESVETDWKKAEAKEAKKQEISKTVLDFCKGETEVLIVLPNSLNQNVEAFKESLNCNITIKAGENIGRDDLTRNLLKIGLTRTATKPEKDEFQFLGDVLKIVAGEKEFKVDFFDEEVESIKENGERVDFFTLTKNVLNFNGQENLFLNIIERVNPLLFISEPKRILDEIFYQSLEDEKLKVNNIKIINKDNFFEKIYEKIKNCAIFREIYDSAENLIQINNQTVGARKYFYDYKSLVSDLAYYQKYNFKVLLCAGSKESAKSIFEYLAQTLNGIQLFDEEKFEKNNFGIFIAENYIPLSASFLDEKFVVLGTDDIVKKSNAKVYKYVSKKSIYLPKVGDYVVHELHGIGKCIQIERLKLLNYEKDYVVVEYNAGDRLYVPSEQLNLLSAYIGPDEEPKLNKIGGVEFARQKEKVKNSVKKMTFDLLEVYAEREKRKGFVYEKDNYLYDEFEKSFPFEETEDQIKAIKDIARDMESERILDRLICGDVGYGKTEVALRAAYKAILSGKQVAFLCPTTVLSEQHYNTCKQRFKDFMVNVEVLNRFKKGKAETEDLLQRLKEGKIDIICGTHRLLGKDVEFKNLGLLILDEEQKFGVEHKDKIKRMKLDVDVLTLSATPIPRTLQMSLSGIRDISLIETPPKNRLPVQTFICEYTDGLLVDACKKEVARGGQVFIIYNEIKTIEEFANKVRNLLPECKIGVAHAQMNEKELKDTISKMYGYEFDIVIATTLIENGVDNPLANTLLVVNADRLGLSELYQLKGRVGRSDRLAFAYFTFEPQKILTSNAYKRLEALSQFTELGSGFKIAMRDLEIRGAGDILGREQHGHLTKIGYELYNKIVAEAVSEIRGQKKKEYKDIKMEIAIDAYISSDFIKIESERIAAYSKISELKSKEQFDKLLVGLAEFGEVPKEVKNLMKVGLLKNLAQENLIEKVIINDSQKRFILYKQEEIITNQIALALKKFSNQTALIFEKSPVVEFKCAKSKLEILDLMIDFLSTDK